jgi:hypothetical protein
VLCLGGVVLSLGGVVLSLAGVVLCPGGVVLSLGGAVLWPCGALVALCAGGVLFAGRVSLALWPGGAVLSLGGVVLSFGGVVLWAGGGVLGPGGAVLCAGGVVALEPVPLAAGTLVASGGCGCGCGCGCTSCCELEVSAERFDGWASARATVSSYSRVLAKATSLTGYSRSPGSAAAEAWAVTTPANESKATALPRRKNHLRSQLGAGASAAPIAARSLRLAATRHPSDGTTSEAVDSSACATRNMPRSSDRSSSRRSAQSKASVCSGVTVRCTPASRARASNS